jgi:signal transduction histidine kinase
VFEKFYRGPHAAHGGAGLGLAICRAIAAVHRGALVAENREGGGAVFRLVLPLGAPPGTPPPPSLDGEAPA